MNELKNILRIFSFSFSAKKIPRINEIKNAIIAMDRLESAESIVLFSGPKNSGLRRITVNIGIDIENISTKRIFTIFKFLIIVIPFNFTRPTIP